MIYIKISALPFQAVQLLVTLSFPLGFFYAWENFQPIFFYKHYINQNEPFDSYYFGSYNFSNLKDSEKKKVKILNS